MEHLEVQPHLQLKKSQIQPVVLLVGDPGRVDKVAKLADSSKDIAYNREYRTCEVEAFGQKILVVSHGIGSAGAAICFEELIELGAKVLIRAGTCGSLQPRRIKQGDLVVAFAAAAEDGVSKVLVPPKFPSVADPKVHNHLFEVMKKIEGANVLEGTVLTDDIFFASKYTKDCKHLEQYADANVDIVDMEVSTLFTVARLRGVKAAACCAVDGSPIEWDKGNYDSRSDVLKTSVELMLKGCLQTLAELRKEMNL